MKRRRLADVAAEYAAEISGSEQKLMKSERVCEVLRRQHGGAYPVALNSGTRPVVCRALADALGKAKYEELCAAGSSPKPGGASTNPYVSKTARPSDTPIPPPISRTRTV